MSTPRSWYRRAQCPTSRKLAATICFRAASSPAATRFASSTCCSWSGIGNWSRSRNISPNVSDVLTALFIIAPDALRSLSFVPTRVTQGSTRSIQPSRPRDHAIGVFGPSLRRFPARAGLRPMPGRMVLLRHGATAWSESGRHTGRTDIPLLAEGCEQARAAGALVRQFGPATFGQVLTSPLVRAEESCTLAGFTGDPDPDLMEWDYGAYEGLTTAEIRQRRPGWTLWEEGVPEGERAADVGRRAD